MTPHTIRLFAPDDVNQVIALEKKFKARYPDVRTWGDWNYQHDKLHRPENRFVAFDEKGNLLSFGHVIPKPLPDEAPAEFPHLLFLDLNADIELEDPEHARELMYNRLLERVAEIRSTLSPRRTQLVVQHFTTVAPTIDFLKSKGFRQTGSLYYMTRDLPLPIQDVPQPEGIEVRACTLDAPEEVKPYLEAHNECFPEDPLPLEQLETLKNIPYFTNLVASSGNEIAGSVLSIAGDRKGAAYIEGVFVRPAFQRRGIARHLLCESLKHLRERGFETVSLRVEGENLNATALYRSVGYEVAKEEAELTLDL